MKRFSNALMAGLAVLVIPAASHAVNLLTEPGFENNNLTTLAASVGPPLQSGVWGYEVASRVGPTGGINPYAGKWMLKMDDDGLSYSQVFQFVPISPGSTLKADAMFNSDAQAANLFISLFFFATGNDWGSPISFPAGPLTTLDNNPATWQNVSFTATAPSTANWVGVEFAFQDSSLYNANGVVGSGFVDEASLTVVPEPGTLAALATGLGSLVFLRRRK